MGLDRKCEHTSREIGPEAVAHLSEECGASFIRCLGDVARKR
jgi:hypothetical protein